MKNLKKLDTFTVLSHHVSRNTKFTGHVAATTHAYTEGKFTGRIYCCTVLMHCKFTGCMPWLLGFAIYTCTCFAWTGQFKNFPPCLTNQITGFFNSFYNKGYRAPLQSTNTCYTIYSDLTVLLSHPFYHIYYLPANIPESRLFITQCT